MKQADVKIGAHYTARISGNLVTVRIDRGRQGKTTANGKSRHGGWDATNLATNKKVHIKSAAKLRGKARTPRASAKATAAADQENARLRDERAQSPDGQTASERAMAESAQHHDPNKCATPRCKGRPALTHLGKPLCQKCWDKQCAAEEEGATAALDDSDESTADDDAATAAIVEIAKAANAEAAGSAKPKRARKPATDAGEAKPKRVSALDAAAQVLQTSGVAMNSKEMIAALLEQGLWTSPNGKTPHATLYSAILREIGHKGEAARFRKGERGRGEFNAGAAAKN